MSDQSRTASTILWFATLATIAIAVRPTSASAQEALAPAQAPAQLKHGPVGIVSKTQLRSLDVPAGTHLNYYGGPVISNVQVVVVFWGTNVDSTVRTYIPEFYRGVTNSAYFDLLSEYSTNLPSGTNQSIGRGSFLQAITISPANQSSSVNDAQIQSELIRQLNIGGLPQPRYDLAGNVNTLYMIYFPPGVVITGQGGLKSCVAGGFCGYHGTTLFNDKFLPYGVFPDFSDGSLCNVGCGDSSNFNNLTAVSSHELAESVTDVGIGQATALAYPVAWYDPNFDEIGDICAEQQAIIATPVANMVIQKEFSNILGGCVSSGAHPVYQITGPSAASPGTPLSLTLNANNPVAGQGKHTSFVGTVHFTSTDPAAVLPSDYAFTPNDQGSHTFSITTQKNGTQTVTARDTVNGAITASITLTSRSTFSLAASSPSLTLPAASSQNLTISTAIATGIAQTVSLSLAGLPSGASSSFSPSILNSGQSSTLTINSGTAAPGNYPLTVTGVADAEQHTASINLVIVDRFRSGDLRTNDSADRLSWTYEPSVVNSANVEFKICKAPAITWWKEFVVRSGNFVFADFGVKNSTACASQQVSVSSLQHGFQMELWKAKFLGISTQVEVLPSNYFGYLAPGSRVTMTWLKD